MVLHKAMMTTPGRKEKCPAERATAILSQFTLEEVRNLVAALEETMVVDLNDGISYTEAIN